MASPRTTTAILIGERNAHSIHGTLATSGPTSMGQSGQGTDAPGPWAKARGPLRGDLLPWTRPQPTEPMAKITLKGNPISTIGDLPTTGAKAPDFTLVKNDLGNTTLRDFAGKPVILNIFPSIDTAVCATSVRKFNQQAAAHPEVTVLCVSNDLPFAQKRFCGAEGIDRVHTLSAFRSDFGKSYGVTIQDGPLQGLLARAIVVIGKDGKVVHRELVPEVAQEPNYDQALAAIR